MTVKMVLPVCFVRQSTNFCGFHSCPAYGVPV